MADIGRNCPVESVTDGFHPATCARLGGPRDRGRWPPTPHVDYHDDQRVPNVRIATRHPSTPPPAYPSTDRGMSLMPSCVYKTGTALGVLNRKSYDLL